MTDLEKLEAIRAVFLKYKPTYRFLTNVYREMQATFPDWCKRARSYMALTWWAGGEKVPDPLVVAFMVQNGKGYVKDLFTDLIPYVSCPEK